MVRLSNQKKWDRRFMELASQISSWSKDPNTKVGAVIVDEDRRVCGIGFNGFPAGVVDRPEVLRDSETKHACTIHAEVNAIHNSARTKGCTIYTTLAPCAQCMAQIIQAGIVAVVYGDRHPKIDYTHTQQMSAESGVLLFAQTNYDKHPNV
jgi:dCMP deaminase